MKTLRILGTRGVPAAHGGFETFAEQLSLFLAGQGWRVIVYCQEEGTGPIVEDNWEGVERIRIFVSGSGTGSTVLFDLKATWHAAQHRDLCLTLGYNTAVFCALLRLRGVPNLINMDGIEWSRAKWSKVAKTWFYLNERAACWLGNHLIADHPEIKRHLSTRVKADKVTTIPYGAPAIIAAPLEPLYALNLVPGRFLTVIARPEPENSVLEIVRGFSMKLRGHNLVVLGNYAPSGNAYHQAVLDAASAEVVFVGAIYDRAVVESLRFYSAAYVHGHKVGGTNPSLVEAMGAGNAVIAHDNRFNRWVVGDGARFFDGPDSFSAILGELLDDPQSLSAMRAASRRRFEAVLTWPSVLQQYEVLLSAHHSGSGAPLPHLGALKPENTSGDHP